MFGYLNINKQKLNDGQQGLWQSFMCQLCISTKRLIGNLPRMFVSNDLNAFNVLFHSVLQKDVVVLQSRCASHPIKKRSILQTDEISDNLALSNLLLMRWSLYDDVVDDKKISKKIALRFISSAYQKCKNKLADMDKAIELRYAELRKLEKEKCAVIDLVAHPFACLTQDFCKLSLGEHTNDHIETLCYNLGKWIYLIDAVDDAADDLRNADYNPFVSCYNAKNMAELVRNADEIQFTLYATLNRIAQSFNDLNLTKYHCVLTNILFDSIRDKTTMLLNELKQYKTE